MLGACEVDGVVSDIRFLYLFSVVLLCLVQMNWSALQMNWSALQMNWSDLQMNWSDLQMTTEYRRWMLQAVVVVLVADAVVVLNV